MKRSLLAIFLLTSTLSAAPNDWSRFRGPNGSGVSDTTGLPTEFSPTNNVVWKTATPAGHSSPVLTKTHIFLTGIDGEQLFVLALDRVYAFFQDFGFIAFTADGKEQWRLPFGPFNMFYGFGASPTLVDGLLILPVDQDSGSYLIAVDAKTGKVRYKVDRPGVISGYSTPTVYQPKDGPKQILIPESFQLTA